MTKFDKLPVEIQEKMLERQVEQGNKRDAWVFRNGLDAFIGGFCWSKTPEGYAFWYNVLIRENYDLFFERYPKTTGTGFEPLPEKVMMVWNKDSDFKLQKVVFGRKNGKFLVWGSAKTIEEAKDEVSVVDWDNAEEIPQAEEIIELNGKKYKRID